MNQRSKAAHAIQCELKINLKLFCNVYLLDATRYSISAPWCNCNAMENKTIRKAKTWHCFSLDGFLAVAIGYSILKLLKGTSFIALCEFGMFAPFWGQHCDKPDVIGIINNKKSYSFSTTTTMMATTTTTTPTLTMWDEKVENHLGFNLISMSQVEVDAWRWHNIATVGERFPLQSPNRIRRSKRLTFTFMGLQRLLREKSWMKSSHNDLLQRDAIHISYDTCRSSLCQQDSTASQWTLWLISGNEFRN